MIWHIIDIILAITFALSVIYLLWYISPTQITRRWVKDRPYDLMRKAVYIAKTVGRAPDSWYIGCEDRRCYKKDHIEIEFDENKYSTSNENVVKHLYVYSHGNLVLRFYGGGSLYETLILDECHPGKWGTKLDDMYNQLLNPTEVAHSERFAPVKEED